MRSPVGMWSISAVVETGLVFRCNACKKNLRPSKDGRIRRWVLVMTSEGNGYLACNQACADAVEDHLVDDDGGDDLDDDDDDDDDPDSGPDGFGAVSRFRHG